MEKEKHILRECHKHGLTEHTLRSDGGYRCKKCQVETVQKKRKSIKEQLVEYKGGKCVICGYCGCISALEFHHINSNEKDFSIGQKGYTRSMAANKAEVDKCILVCANHHREIHEGLIDLSKINKGEEAQRLSSGLYKE